MKKIFLASAMALMIGAGASAKTADELRIYINPGHGSWTGDDRPCVTVGHQEYSRENTDTTDFFESNTDLIKGLSLLEYLRAAGLQYDPTLNQTGDLTQIGAARDMSNNIVMSRVKNGPYHDDNGTANQFKNEGRESEIPADLQAFNRSLSEICVEVDANNFDMFISIHSNALTDGTTTNYPLFLYRGYDDAREAEGVSVDQQSTSRTMAQACWPYAFGNEHMQWTNYSLTSTNIRGDVNFYGSGSMSARGFYGYLGVLKHAVPGFLVEGYFHTYQPARHRAMNWDVDYIEGISYGRGIADYFELAKESTGDIYGIVRDKHEKFTHTYYKPNPVTDDAFMPLNGIKVYLKKDGETVAEYTTDQQYNGAFVFKHVAPGNYTIEFESESYKSIDPVEVTVAAATTTYTKAKLENVDYVAPAVVYENYPDELNNPAILAASEYTFQPSYSDQPIEELAGKTVRRMILKDQNAYILAVDEAKAPTLLVVDTKTHTVLANVSTQGMEGTELNCSDIQLTSDGVLLACPKELNHFNDEQVQSGETRGCEWIYKWANDDNGLPTGDPIAWISTQGTGNYYRAYVGDTFVYTGTANEGKLGISAQTASGTNIRVQVLTVVNGIQAASSFYKPLQGSSGGYFSLDKLGEDYRFIVSPLDDDRYMTVGSGTTVAMPEYAIMCAADSQPYALLADGIMDVATPRVGFFKYAGHSFMAFPDITEGKNVGVKLADITAGIDKAKLVGTVNTSLEEADLANIAAAGVTIITRNDYDEITDGNIDLVLLRGNGLMSRFTTTGVDQPQGRAEYAYDINVAGDIMSGNYTVTFKATGDAPQAAVILTNVDNEEDTARYEIGAVEKGDNEYNFNVSDLKGSNYSLAIELVSKSIARAAQYASRSNGLVKRGGVVVITDPEFDSFGYITTVTGGANGFDVFTPDGTYVDTYFKSDSRFDSGNQSSPFRGDQRDGKAVFADWSDKGAGYWVLDPKDMSQMSQLVSGTKDSKGSYYLTPDDATTIIGGGSSCVAFQGTGENTRMYSFLEDYPAPNTTGTSNCIYRYDIGSADQITAAPDKKFDSFNGAGLCANQNIEIKAIEDGFFVAQIRTAGNNAAGTPSFFYSDNDGNVMFNSAELKDIVLSSNSGIAINHDRSLMAVGQQTGISFFTVEWKDNVPSFTLLYTIPETSSWAQFAFDYANNLHVYSRENNGYHAYSIPNEAPTVVVPAKSSMLVHVNATSVESVAVDQAADAPAVYYNLNGVRMSGETLTPGIYIKVCGDKAQKVIIR